MKTKLQSLFIVIALLAGVHQAIGQLPVIGSFSQNGVLVCTNLQPGTCGVGGMGVVVVRAVDQLGRAVGLDTVTVNSNGTISVSVPMFYRVRGVAQPTPRHHTDGMALIPAGAFTMGDTLDGESDAIPTAT